jgi:Uma2 family endonuclease
MICWYRGNGGLRIVNCELRRLVAQFAIHNLFEENMMTLVKEMVSERLVTADEFEQILALPQNQDRLLELINGEIVEKMPTEEHGMVTSNIDYALNGFNREHKLGRVGVEVRHRLPDDRLNSRMPDISFSAAKRPLVRQGGVPAMPDLAVEIKSPTDTVRRMREKAAYYLEHGVRLVWLIYPAHRVIEVYQPDADIEFLTMSDTLTGGDVLPGFAIPVAEIFADPLEETDIAE